MRLFSLLAALFVALLVPTTAQAGTCPALEEGVVDEDAYRLGELVDFYGTYHDFADPGTVTVAFERITDGAIREYTANNSPDGSWYLRFTFESADDVGVWNVTVVVAQTGALDTCTDRVSIAGRSGLPRTSTMEPAGHGADPGDSPLPVVFALAVVAGGLASTRRRPGQPSGDQPSV